MINLSILFIILFSTWLLLSGIFTASYITIGFLSCLGIVILYRFIYKDKIHGALRCILGIILYCIWLFKEIAVSSFKISLKMWQLDPEISPQTDWIPSNLKDDIAIAIFANSITLTPGTVTIGTKEGMLHVHALTEDDMQELKNSRLLSRVSRITKSGIQ